MRDAGPGPRAGGHAVVTTLALLLTTAAWGAAAERSWRVEAALGAAHSFDSTLRLEQPGFPTLEIEAKWENRNFESPPYYGLRVSRSDSRGAWAVRFVHLKVYLAEPPLEVERFSVSHGYNLLTLERSLAAGGFELWAGLGLVIAHPESTVRGRTMEETEGGLGGGYYATGPTGALALSRRLILGDRLALVPELRLTLSRARVPIADGHSAVPNASVHFLLGLELRF